MSAVLKVHEPSARYLLTAAPPLLGVFDIVGTAPDATERLRELVLDLAVRGKLVAQDESDEHASRLLERIFRLKSEGAVAGRARRSSEANEGEDLEPTHELPPGWVWASLSSIGNINPRNVAADSLIASFVPMSAIPVAFSGKHSSEPRPWQDIKSGFTQFAEGDVGVAKITPCFENGKSTVFCDLHGGIGAGTTELHVVRPLGGIEPRYILLFLKSPRFLRGGEAVMTGTAGQKRLPRTYFENCPFPLPPLAEQARIVARVDELMRLCDALEEKGRLEAEQHARLLSTLLGTLTDSATPEELAANWHRVAEHFDLLLDRPETVDALESSVLTLAMQGRLTARDPSEEPASALLERVKAEKRKFLVASKQRLDKPSAPVSESEQRFQLPQSWEWARLQELAMTIVDCPHSTPKFVQSGVLCLDTNSFKKGQLLEHKLRYVEEATYAERTERLEPRPGDLVFAREGSVGESLIIPTGTRACLGQRVMLFRFSPLISVEYVRLAISSPSFLGALLELHKGIGAKHVNVGDMREAIIPVPPLAEQLRIVEAVGVVNRLCATLRERLQAQQATQSRLAEALVEQALAA